MRKKLNISQTKIIERHARSKLPEIRNDNIQNHKRKKKHDGTNEILKQFVLIKMVQSVNT